MKYDKMFSRNIGFLTEEEQAKISQLSVGIAGAGGDGGLLAERLVRFGVNRIILADPEVFEIENINRQFAAYTDTIGSNKAAAVANELRRINPKAEIVTFEGVSRENVREFVSMADLIIDEIEFSIPSLSVMLAREARKQRKYVFMGANIGWGASSLCFAPDGMKFEEFFAYNEETKEIDATRYAKQVPSYFDRGMLMDVLEGKISIPSISSAVGLVASLLSSSIILFWTGKKNPRIVPEFLHYDMFELAEY
ncbi:MAG TPA: ThiF family adenylyltransferase [Candidatus Moranbacteria bacterium]|jgi:molybdopterin/thiamine biosynthesis adenylyltransferase|nr:hypothetical protein [Candidatus Moranbacteria bacterium]HPX94506.1 ThiF family adenylyltransferase [Candidatus Moranbacteria bacterium]